MPDTKLATLRTEVDQAALVDAIRLNEGGIREHLRLQGAVCTSEFWVIYHGLVTPDGESAIEVAVPFTGTVEPTRRIAIRIEGAHREAYTTVARDDCFYPRIMRAYEVVLAHAPGLGPAREIYLDYWERLAGDDPFVHVARPIGD